MKAKRTEVGKAIEKLVKAGKPLSGLLVGMASFVGVAAESEVKAPQLAGVPLPPPRIVATNKVSEVHGRMVRGRTKPVVMGKMPVASVRQDVKSPPVSVELYLVVEGDTLTKIAKRHKTTVAELKRLNGFDDVRANDIKAGEVIRVASEPEPPVTTNSVNEAEGPMMEGGDVIMGAAPVE